MFCSCKCRHWGMKWAYRWCSDGRGRELCSSYVGPGVGGAYELELELIQSHMTQNQCCGVKWLRVRCASKSDRGLVVQASAIGVVSTSDAQCQICAIARCLGSEDCGGEDARKLNTPICQKTTRPRRPMRTTRTYKLSTTAHTRLREGDEFCSPR